MCQKQNFKKNFCPHDVCKNSVGSVYIAGLSESVFRKLCPVSFFVVGECQSVLL